MMDTELKREKRREPIYERDADFHVVSILAGDAEGQVERGEGRGREEGTGETERGVS